jgi:tetratricopeptide (TPR) repeat protein
VVEVVSNPYDFTKAISDPELLAGRQEEIARIEYYLDQAVGERPKYYNLALVGKRASGKTSLLNVIRHLMDRRRILATRIMLNKEMVANSMQLYREIVDGILAEGQKYGMYRGFRGWFSRVKRIHGSADIEIEIPGAKVRFTKESKEPDFSQQLLVMSMGELLSEARKKGLRGIAILLDECDLLVQNVALLQKLRNVFQNLDGYIFVFTGTEEMLSSISDVFSPIRRSFITVNVTDFTSPEQTKECILKPLTEEERKLVDLQSIAEIHGFTGGSPYEITLVAHHMYRRYKLSGASRIRLTVEVLDDVLAEVDRLRSGTHKETVSRIRTLFPPSLMPLVSSLSFTKCTEEELAWYLLLDKLETLTQKAAKDAIDYNRQVMGQLVTLGVLEQDENRRLSFAGDRFDELYLRYYALSKGVSVDIYPKSDPILVISTRLERLLISGVTNFDSLAMYDKSGNLGGRLFGFTGAKKLADAGPLTIQFSPHKRQVELYQDIELAVRFRVNVGYLANGYVVQYRFADVADRDSMLVRIRSMTNSLSIVGIELIEEDEITLSNRGLRMTQEGRFSESILLFNRAITLNPNIALPHLGIAYAYLGLGNYAESLEHCEKALGIEPKWSLAWELKGRCILNMGDYRKSIQFFDRAIEYDPENWTAWDNKGRALFNVEEFEKASSCFERAVQALPSNIDTLRLYARALCRLNSLERALEVTAQILNSMPSDLEALMDQVEILLAMERNGEALRAATTAATAHPNCSDAHERLGYILLESGRVRESLEQFDAAIGIDEADPVAWYNKACALSKLGEKERAIDALARAIKLDSHALEAALSDSDFASIADEPQFKALTAMQEGFDRAA